MITKRALVLGGGGREHAISKKFVEEGVKVYCWPGNAGIGEIASVLSSQRYQTVDDLIACAYDLNIGLALSGPEQYLVDGWADRFRAQGIPFCGPNALAAAVTEGSKMDFMSLLATRNIPRPRTMAFLDLPYAVSFLQRYGWQNFVIKDDGLAGGKGVTVPESGDEAYEALRGLFLKNSVSPKVLLQERLYGPEHSATFIVDGVTFRMLPMTRDNKRAQDGDKGAMTGGMGAHTVDLSAEDLATIEFLGREVVNALIAAGIEYRGFLYLGLIRTEEGFKILEANCRLGDPETQALLASIDTDLFEYCTLAACGSVSNLPLIERKRHAVCLVLASNEYPAASSRDQTIGRIDEAEKLGATVLHAGSRWDPGLNQFMTNRAGRVLGIVGTDEKLPVAGALAYRAADEILAYTDALRCRRDIVRI